ncbi:MAG: hypothetical protein IAG13_31030 [Deltaproteobacteria bacterium]|nr:hypothetical protein [Nannocystaceae bacterium]
MGRRRVFLAAIVLVSSCARPHRPGHDVQTANDDYVRAFAAWGTQVCGCEPDAARCLAEFERVAPKPWSRCHARAGAGHEAELAQLYRCWAKVFAAPDTCPTSTCVQGCKVFDAACRERMPCRSAAEGKRACGGVGIPASVVTAVARCDDAR